MNLQEKIAEFKALKETLAAYGVAGAMLNWDMSTGGSKKGMGYRAKMIGIYTMKSFEIQTGQEMKDLLDILLDHMDELDEVTRRMVVLSKKTYDNNTKIPKDEARAYAELQAKSQIIWEDAKEAQDYSMFKDVLGEIIDYQKKFVDYRGYKDHPYNPLLDDYEEGMTVEILDEYFDNLKASIVPLVKAINETELAYNTEFLTRSFPIEDQKAFCIQLMDDLGFDYDAGEVKESVHPFTNGMNVNDVRLTVRYFENLMTSAVFSAAHEGGHAIYEQNINEDLQFTGLDTGVSSGIHESQSRMYENIICRSKAFWEHYYPKLKAFFPEQLKDVTLEDFYAGINKVENSFIRVEADELTYSLHIIIRYEIEKAIMTGQVSVDELPALWNKKYKDYLGLDVPNDELGVLQDVHWSFGLFGYFPTYSIGSAYASQFAYYLQEAVDFEGDLQKGDYKNVNEWLHKHIHVHGSLKTPEEIIELATGKRFDSKYYVEYLTNKYKSLYNL
ncbi:carboxypeptidase M32 [Acidaminobacter sp. JC074]|uniref:carboxypeptidase M32 n=1 Tax=Acidaminobacter sp. JC074 TaxID=2530199 RepID=UPI001F0D52C9|nr:carboxypeptidase M32 [Acidaminobacter sp. JC074]MCH4890401.1 carboxypeptidase M32 [Acidaminobacter sp. JC074]